MKLRYDVQTPVGDVWVRQSSFKYVKDALANAKNYPVARVWDALDAEEVIDVDQTE